MNREWDFDYEDVRNRLNKLEGVVSDVNKVGLEAEEPYLFFALLKPGTLQKCAPTPRRPPPILPLMPQPVDEPGKVTSESPPPYQEGQGLDENVEDSTSPEPTPPTPNELPITDDLLTAPSEKLPASASSPRRVPLSTTAVHEELSAQLAQMATQLKRNAIHFSDTLAKDQAVVEETKLKLESNFDELQKERTRLRDHSGKSSGTTWLIVFSVIAVLVSFFVMFFIIRLTR